MSFDGLKFYRLYSTERSTRWFDFSSLLDDFWNEKMGINEKNACPWWGCC